MPWVRYGPLAVVAPRHAEEVLLRARRRQRQVLTQATGRGVFERARVRARVRMRVFRGSVLARAHGRGGGRWAVARRYARRGRTLSRRSDSDLGPGDVWTRTCQ